jgi:hypothetical protein
MRKSLERNRLIAGIAFFCSAVVTGVAATAIPQAVAQKLPRELLIAQSAVDEEVNLKFESRGCRKTKTTQVTCDVLVTNLATQRQGIRFSVSNSAIPNTNAIDSSGTVYPVQRTESGASFSDLVVSDGSACGCFTVNLASGIPTKVTFIFEVPQDVTELAALDIGYWWYKDSSSSGVSHRTAVSNIGTIASQSNPIRQRPKQR